MIRLAIAVLAFALSGCSTTDNDVIDQAIAARIYNQNVNTTTREYYRQ